MPRPVARRARDVTRGQGFVALATSLLLIVGVTAAACAQGSRETRGGPAGEFDFYVLALSWSPGFCEASRNRDRDQCESGSGLRFVVHGLWPQNDQGYPSFCEPGRRSIPRPALAEAHDVFPAEGLARYQWRKHGSCSGLSPSAYFSAVRRARALVHVPDDLESASTFTKVLPIEIERAFAEANRGLRPEMMSVQCGRRIFQEIRICLDRNLRGFRACPEVDRDGCRAGAIDILPPR
jgi:ribonuclease T2